MTNRLHRLPTGLAALAAVTAGLLAPTSTALAADHRDGPRVTNTALTLGALDLNDLYLFNSPSARNNVVAILTTGGAGVGVLTPPAFFPGAVYEYRISNDGVATTDEIVLQIVFSQPNARGQQSYTVTALDANGRSENLARGVTGRTVRLRGGGQMTAGIFDDPFFFDALAFNRFRAAVQAGSPLAARVAPFVAPSIPNNFFGNFNILAIVIEVPKSRLGLTRNRSTVTMWNRVLADAGDGRGVAQFDRQAIPAINTVLNFNFGTRPDLRDTFNSITPSDDIALRTEAAERMNLIFGTSPTTATALANTLLPDVSTLNTRSNAGFPNGRRLQDDVIDIELGLLTEGALTSDRVINDSTFSNRFPYLGAPLGRASSLRAMRSLLEAADSESGLDNN